MAITINTILRKIDWEDEDYNVRIEDNVFIIEHENSGRELTFNDGKVEVREGEFRSAKVTDSPTDIHDIVRKTELDDVDDELSAFQSEIDDLENRVDDKATTEYVDSEIENIDTEIDLIRVDSEDDLPGKDGPAIAYIDEEDHYHATFKNE